MVTRERAKKEVVQGNLREAQRQYVECLQVNFILEIEVKIYYSDSGTTVTIFIPRSGLISSLADHSPHPQLLVGRSLVCANAEGFVEDCQCRLQEPCTYCSALPQYASGILD